MTWVLRIRVNIRECKWGLRLKYPTNVSKKLSLCLRCLFETFESSLTKVSSIFLTHSATVKAWYCSSFSEGELKIQKYKWLSYNQKIIVKYRHITNIFRNNFFRTLFIIWCISLFGTNQNEIWCKNNNNNK